MSLSGAFSGGVYKAHMPMTKRTLNTADPTMVPNPTDESLKVPMRDVASSGADPPAAMRVAPETSSLRSKRSEMISNAGTNSSSHTMAMQRKMYLERERERERERGKEGGLGLGWVRSGEKESGKRWRGEVVVVASW